MARLDPFLIGVLIGVLVDMGVIVVIKPLRDLVISWSVFLFIIALAFVLFMPSAVGATSPAVTAYPVLNFVLLIVLGGASLVGAHALMRKLGMNSVFDNSSQGEQLALLLSMLLILVIPMVTGGVGFVVRAVLNWLS